MTANTYTKISAEKAKSIMSGSGNYTLLDVRTQEEFDEGYIEGAILLPYNEIAGQAEKKLPDKEAAIFVYCHSGNRSKMAAQILTDLGYTDVYEMGGIIDWPYDTVNDTTPHK